MNFVGQSLKHLISKRSVVFVASVLLCACNQPVVPVEDIAVDFEEVTESPVTRVTSTIEDGSLILEADWITIFDRNEPEPEVRFLPAARSVPASDVPVLMTDETVPSEPVSVFEFVKARAAELAAEPYSKGKPLPKFAQSMTYDDYRLIHHKPDAELFAETGSMIRGKLDTRGSLFKTEIKVNVIRDGVSRPLAYRAKDFNFDTLKMTDEDRTQLGLAGFRLLSPLNRGGKFDEVMSVKGASFFRVLGAGNYYGASARGIALKTASPEGEEFPNFTEFWIEEPGELDRGIVFHALMDGPSVTGAYEFHVVPGTNTVVDVKAELFARKPLTRVGLAPLTSMFQIAPHDPDSDMQDFRPHVHDSDGLSAMLQNGEWIWRPLSNPSTLQISSFANQPPKGFGLMQRTRDFESFQDIEAHYESRPSVWITPGEGWSQGELTLVEIPTPNEYHDNIISYWQLADAIPAGESHEFSYRMSWGVTPPFRPALIEVSSTRTGVSEATGKRLFVVDFEVENPDLLEGVEPKVTTSAGIVERVQLIPDTRHGKGRLIFEIDLQGAPAAELRAVLERVDTNVSETWLYRWSAT